MIAAVTAIVGVVLLAGGAIAAVTHAYSKALVARQEAAAHVGLAARLERDLAIMTATAETTDRLRRAETARADALEMELADADQAALDRPDLGARRRVLERWRAANAAAAAPAAGGDGAGPVSDPAHADAAG